MHGNIALSVVVAFVLRAVFAGNNDDFPGTCPQISPASGFDLERFDSQKWYLVEETDNDSDRCVNMEVTTKPTNSIRITGVEKDGDKFDKRMSFTMTTPGILSINDGGEMENVTIVATDYDTYAVLYNCENDSDDKTFDEDVSIYVHKDKMTSPEAPFAAAKSAIQGNGIRSTNFQKIDHTKCPDSA